MEILGTMKGMVDRFTKPPLVVGGENLTGMSQTALKELVFRRLVFDKYQWNGAHPMSPETAREQMEEIATSGRQGMTDFLQGAEQMSQELGGK